MTGRRRGGRFTAGVLIGGSSSGIAWAAGASPLWAAVTGLAAGVLAYALT